MTDGDEEPTDDDAEPAEAEAEADAEDEEDVEVEVTVESLTDRLDAVSESLEAAETEADLDEVEADLDAVAADLEGADLPEPDDEDEEAPAEELSGRVDDLRASLEEARGPYAEDVVAAIEEAQSTLSDTRWTERGESEIAAAVATYLADVEDHVEASFDDPAEDADAAALAESLDAVAEAVGGAGLDPDDDAETIAALVETTDALSAGLEDAQEWDDLETREQLEAQGFYDVLGHYKDYPPEWSALKEWEKRGNVEMVLLALDSFGSDFMEEHCLEALIRMNDQAAFDAMHQRASRRDKPGIKALGKMAAEDAVETLLEYVDTDSDPQLQKVTFRALGEIGDERATQALANKLEMDNDNVRPVAARALGLLGDTRAVEPLADTLENDESDTVRAAAAWALRQIGTEAALEAAAGHADDRSYLVAHESELAAETLDAATPTAGPGRT